MSNRHETAESGLWPWLVLPFLVLGAGCDQVTQISQALTRAGHDRDIAAASQAIDAASDDAGRARGLSQRGRGYSEKARYARAFRLIPIAEYGRLFDLAIADHDRAVALAPGDAQPYLDRGLTWYERATLEAEADPARNAAFRSAEADFTRALERDRRNARAWDMRGLIHSSRGEHDAAIADYAEEKAVDEHMGRLRLAEAHCARAASRQKDREYDAAIADYEKVIELAAEVDGCDCQPDAPLAWIYFETRQYDRSWEVVKRAQKAHRYMPDEFVEELRKASGRNG